MEVRRGMRVENGFKKVSHVQVLKPLNETHEVAMDMHEVQDKIALVSTVKEKAKFSVIYRARQVYLYCREVKLSHSCLVFVAIVMANAVSLTNPTRPCLLPVGLLRYAMCFSKPPSTLSIS